MAFSQKRISIQLQLANGQFHGGGNTATIEGLRCSCHIVNKGGADQSDATAAIFGLPLDLMNQLSNVGTQYNRDFLNTVVIRAGDSSGMDTVYEGQIFSAFVDAMSMPQVCFRISAKPNIYDQVKPVKPTSIKGSADVAGMMSNLAKQMGLAFEGNGVNVKLANPYYYGSAWMQAMQIAEHAGIEWIVDKGTLAISMPGKPRQGSTPLISKETGLVGYPAFNETEIILRALYNPAVRYGGDIEVKSDLTPANGKWIVKLIEYDLESQMPGGSWFMTIIAYPIGPTTP
ncbi:baseplate hub protein [Labrys monachus]|uniref:Uncharacterized protein n=1 Tax=Labrys monachus TaxID=217067 RepID=A0ABU0FKY2_9HYPH|nr:hypothetical protein [Labrys monachus]MDQ0395181.1 hypothetical protein [Labrys monachus]